MTKDEKIKTLTTIVHHTLAGGQKEVMVEGKFKLLFKQNEKGDSVCNVSSNHHREWLYQFDWMVPYNATEMPKVVVETKELEDGIFEEIEKVIPPPPAPRVSFATKELSDQEIREKRLEKMKEQQRAKHADI